jgi:hypothetical protein
MTLPRLLISGIHILAIITMSASAAYLISYSFAFERWLEQPLMNTLGWDRAALAWTLFGILVIEGLLVSFLGHWPGPYTLFLSLFFLPSLYAHGSLGWLEFAGLEVEPTQSGAVVGALGVGLMASYLIIRMGTWIRDLERDWRQRNADARDILAAFYFTTGLLLVTLSLATGLGLGLAFSVEFTGGFLSGLLGRIPFGVLTIGITSVAVVAWAIRRLITSQSLLSSDIWRWRRLATNPGSTTNRAPLPAGGATAMAPIGKGRAQQ